MRKQIDVVGAVIVRDGLVLCAQRGPKGSLGGTWEFPGGKIEPGETPRDALIREIDEELRCEVSVGDLITTTTYDYDFGTVTLTTFWCELMAGEPVLTEHAAVVDGREYELDCLIFATGFEVGTSYTRRAGYDVVGRGGVKLSEHWSNGLRTLHGLTSDKFPNCFFVGRTQTGLPVNLPLALEHQTRHVAYILSQARAKGFQFLEPSAEAVDASDTRAAGDWDAYTKVHDEIVKLDNDGEWEQARTKAIKESGKAFQPFDDATRAAVEKNGAVATDDLRSGRWFALLMSGLTLLLGVAAALSVARGIGERRREFS